MRNVLKELKIKDLPKFIVTSILIDGHFNVTREGYTTIMFEGIHKRETENAELSLFNNNEIAATFFDIEGFVIFDTVRFYPYNDEPGLMKVTGRFKQKR